MSDNSEVYEEFSSLVNMTEKQLSSWLDSDESRSVGVKKGTQAERVSSSEDGESTGHESGRTIVKILGKKKADLKQDDYDHMGKVVAYVTRHLAQKPSKEEVETSRWRYSLMNWGHDPLKD